MALTLREYGVALVLLTFGLSVAVSTQANFLAAYDTELNETGQNTLKELKKNAEKNGLDVTKVKKDAGNINTQLGVIGIGARVAKTVLSGIGQVPTMANILINDLNFTPHIAAIFSIPVLAVIFEVISYARQYRT
jgi:pyruvate/2-oxoglutarate dehydrogenase complex dihydrolipoamide dehydrogenase (E3) component